LEHQASVEAEALGLQREFPRVGPETMLGIEINPYAAELARVSVWIGHIQWTQKHGYAAPSNPVLQPLETIECRDAILTKDGKVAEWPAADVIVGNPPFLGGKLMRRVMGDEYCENLFAAFAERIPAEADLVCYWFELARAQIAGQKVKDVGLVATNSIRGGTNREVLNRIRKTGVIHDAWSDEAWTVEGAAVRVSLVCFSDPGSATPAALDGNQVGEIFADLTGRKGLDLTKAVRLEENRGVAFMGDTKGGTFDVPGALARLWLGLPPNANGRPNADVLKPLVNGMDVTRRLSDTWIIDFGWTMGEADAAFYALPFAHLVTAVKPIRLKNSREAYRRFWWRHVEPRPGMWRALVELTRYSATARVAKHRVFVWMPNNVVPTVNSLLLPEMIMLHSAFCTVAFTSYGHSVWDRRWKTGLATHHPQRSKPSHSPLALHQTFPLKDPPAIATPRPSPPPRDNWWKNAISGSTRPTWSSASPKSCPASPIASSRATTRPPPS
jgi:type II restriction/modification system DNA methylase subunit YeeA